MAESAPRARMVPEPFDSASAGDCIVQSSDGLRYKVFRVILSLASPVFRSMFDLPQSATTADSPEANDASNLPDLPVIPVSETSTTLSTLLLLYPATVVRIPNYDLAADVIKAYDKYDINVAGLHPFLHDALLSEEGLTSDPLGVYAVPWRLGMKKEAQKASRYLHFVDLNDAVVKPDLLARSGDLEALLALWDLRVRREKALDEIVGAAPLTFIACRDLQRLTDLWDHTRPGGLASLRAKARESLAAPYPAWSNVHEFFGIPDIVHYWHYCRECTRRHQDLGDGELVRLKDRILAFPQVIDWYEAVRS